jgi:DNA-binding response OmpR family regulator
MPDHFMPVIMLTGNTEKRHVLAARDAGATEFLAKPVTPQAIYSRLVNVIERPRPFVRTKSYFGPCRRRTVLEYGGSERRGLEDNEGDTVQPIEGMKPQSARENSAAE